MANEFKIDWLEISQHATSPDNWARYGKRKIRAAYNLLGLSGVDFNSNCNSCYKDAFISIVLVGRQRGEIPAVADLQENKKYIIPENGIKVLGKVYTKYSSEKDIEDLLKKIPSFKLIIKTRETPANTETEEQK